MVVQAIQVITEWVPSITHWSDSFGLLDWHWASNWTVLAQTANDTDILVNIQKAFDNFIKSGQVWALGIGLVMGYLIRGITA